MTEWFEQIRFRFNMWRYRRGKVKCDQCLGNFRRDALTPTSGDWWICEKCCQRMMAEWGEDIAQFNEKGTL